ncbi:MAG: hypothetical protein R2848_15685 [Thermomicrobiales bacterium]
MNIVGENRWWQRLLYFYLPLGIFVVLLLFPFYWMLIVSFRPDKDLLNTERNPFLPNLLQRTDGFPWFEFDSAGVTLRHYRFLFNDTDFVRWLQNSIIVTVGATALALACSVFIGYALGRFRFRGGTIMGQPSSSPTWFHRRCFSSPWPRSSRASGSTTAIGRSS